MPEFPQFTFTQFFLISLTISVILSIFQFEMIKQLIVTQRVGFTEFFVKQALLAVFLYPDINRFRAHMAKSMSTGQFWLCSLEVLVAWSITLVVFYWTKGRITDAIHNYRNKKLASSEG